MKAHNSWTLRPRITATLGVLLAFALVPLVAAATDVLDREVSFAIAPAPLATVLIEFSQQSGIQVAAADPDISRLHSDGVTGTHPIRDALQTLLQGTGLGFMSLGVNTLAIRPESVISADTGNPAAASGQNAAASPADPRGSPPDTTSSSAVLPSVTITVLKLPEPQQLAGDSVPKFLDTHAKPVGDTKQFARWHSVICPDTSGLSPPENAFVSARVREVAAMVGAPAQPEVPCKANVEIVFTTDTRQLIDHLRTRVPALARLNSRQIENLIERSEPIQAWNVVRPFSDSATAATPEGIASGGRLANSRLTTAHSVDIVATVIVADQRKLNGYSIGAMADYIAVLILSRTQTRPDCSALPSILDLLSQSCGHQEAPTAITAGDIAFLRALYSTDSGKPTALAEDAILDSMRRQLTAH